LIDFNQIEPSWQQTLSKEFTKPYFKNLLNFVNQEYTTGIIHPPAKDVFKAFEFSPLHSLKVVVLGQDPYHGEGQANGLSFSVREGVKHPPSLRNIFKELESDLSLFIPKSGDLQPWAEQGVLLLNSMLTVQATLPGSHQKKGWEEFTDSVIQAISDKKENIVFILWGKYAQSKEELIDESKHCIIKSAHPSPFSAHRGFFGSKPFSKINTFLSKKNLGKINWSLSQ